MSSLSRVGALALIAAAGCASALKQPGAIADHGGKGKDPTALLADARGHFGLRPDVEAVRRAESLFLAAAQADPRGIDGLYGAILCEAWLVEHEPDSKTRAALAASAVQAGQECLVRQPACARCDYGLAIALGIQAREHPSTGFEAMKLIVERLKRAAASDPKLDRAGPARVLALVLVRAPGWPLGPGDPEAAVGEAQKAVAFFPEFPPNQLVLAEALVAAGAVEEGRAAARHALKLAKQGPAAGDPDARDWVAQAERLLSEGDGG